MKSLSLLGAASLLVVPDRYARNPGSMGRTQGLRNEAMPAMKAAMRVMVAMGFVLIKVYFCLCYVVYVTFCWMFVFEVMIATSFLLSPADDIENEEGKCLQSCENENMEFSHRSECLHLSGSYVEGCDILN